MAKKLSRQVEDYIITDILPVEKGNFFSNRFFYQFLIDSDIDNFKIDNDNFYTSLFNRGFHASPLKFKTKNREGFREIGILNPISMIESFYFISSCGNNIIDSIQKNNKYSIRVPYKYKSLLYKYNSGKSVYYSNEEERQQLLISLESSGTFYRHKPYKILTKYLKGEKNLFQNDKYSFFIKFDIENFFGSIYTHTYNWLVTNNPLDAIKLKNMKSIYTTIDGFLQNINGAKTNGIVVGPELSRLLAEFLLVNIEQKIDVEIISKGFTWHKDYEISRFVDDYYLYTNDESVAEIILSIFKANFNEYNLKINDSKTKRLKTSDFTNKVINECSIITNDYIIPIFEVDSPSRHFYSSVRNKVQILINEIGEKERVSSYMLSTIVRKIENVKDMAEKINKKELTNLCFYLVSLNPNYNSIQKLVTICNNLLKFENFDKEYIEHAIYRFSDKIFNSYINDWINFLIFIGIEDINISKEFEDKFISSYLSDKDNIEPKSVAGLLIYLKISENKIDRSDYYEKINNLVRENIKIINKNEFFLDKNCWWIIIFSNCPYPEFYELKIEIDLFLNNLKLKNATARKDLGQRVKAMTLEFLLSGQGFIEWEFSNKDVYSKYYFYTRKRTLFNPDMFDPFEISY